ncbi:glycoside hydrolase family 172 protein [Pseudothermotoga sp.]
MRELYLLNFGLGSLPLLSDAETRSISAENPTGEKGGGAKAVPDENNPAFMLGKGWKVRPCIDLEPQSTTVLADIAGPGIVQHIWITVDPKAYRDTVFRMYWDEEEKPSVEVPLGDFFCNGHGMRYNVVSIPIAVNPSGGFNCYFPMPFRKRALITIENQRWEKITGFFYQITYALTDLPEKIAYFHAQWRRSMTKREHPEHVIVDGIVGQGHYVGTFIAWTQFSSGWWGEGEVKFYIDGDTEHPTICGTGTEDYFGGAWCFGQTFNAPFSGYPLWHRRLGDVTKHAMYRWHIYDPVRFKQSLKVTIQALGWWPNGKFQPLTDDIASVAYWYQVEPHAPFPQLPSLQERWPR